MAEIRASDWGTQEYWTERIHKYLTHELHPKERPRVSFVGVDSEHTVGVIAGHLTRRFGGYGELEWISIRSDYRNRGSASQLLGLLAEWFVAHDERRVCVDVEPSNEIARRFYARHGAVDLKPRWMVWSDIRNAVPAETG
jgi:ribosomal protein S18 acetylase RimI-like enzyme